MTSLASLRRVWAAVLRGAKQLPAVISRLSAKVIGRWEWQPPSWLLLVGRRLAEGPRYLVADTRPAAIALLVLAGAIGGWLWYKGRPVPHYVTYIVTAPGL